MANFFYGLGAQEWAAGGVAWASNTINVALIASGYAPNQNTDQYYSVAVSGGNIVSAGVALGSKTNSLGLLSAANTTWSSVTGSQVTQLVIYVGGTPGSADFLLLNLSSGTNLPVTPNGGNIVASWDVVNGIGTLCVRVDPKDRPLLKRLWEIFNEVLGIPAARGEYGLMVGRPTITQLAPTKEQAERHAELMRGPRFKRNESGIFVPAWG